MSVSEGRCWWEAFVLGPHPGGGTAVWLNGDHLVVTETLWGPLVLFILCFDSVTF